MQPRRMCATISGQPINHMLCFIPVTTSGGAPNSQWKCMSACAEVGDVPLQEEYSHIKHSMGTTS
eukprot:5481418-Pyramimonas_sp.AAC.1